MDAEETGGTGMGVYGILAWVEGAECVKGGVMREIKFRAWDESRDLMLQNVTIYNGMAVESGYQFFNQPTNGNRLALMQFTGLHDKNGKEIYEGDIVAASEYMFEVKWYQNDAAWRLHRDSKGGMGMAGLCNTIEVIGNIYKNPELLK